MEEGVFSVPTLIKIPIIGIVKVRGLRKLPDGAKTGFATVSRENDGKYYISLAYKYEIPDPKPKSGVSIGLDYKVNCLYVDSDGKSPNIRQWFSENQTKLTLEQQRLSRKLGSRKGERKSRNWYKQFHKVAKVQRKIADQRKDFLHKESRRLADTYNIICIEDISIKDMNVDYGDVKNHKAEHNINRSILDKGWYAFTQMLEYKARERGGRVIKVDKNYKSTETCSRCGHVEPLELKTRKWICPACQTHHDRDVNAAINIHNEGLKLLKIS